MKKWNEAEIVELNISETAGFWDDLQDAFFDWVYKQEVKYNWDFTGDRIIGDPNSSSGEPENGLS